MKRISLLFVGLLYALVSYAETPTYDAHPLALPREKSNLRELITRDSSITTPLSVAEEGGYLPDEFTGYSLEGKWVFVLNDYDRNRNVEYYGMWIDNQILFENYSREFYPIYATYDEFTSTLTFTRHFVARDWRGRYVFFEPHAVVNGRYTPSDIQAQYDPQTGALTLDQNATFVWLDYADAAGTEDVYDEGDNWFLAMSARRNDLDKERPENWTCLGEATMIDGWLSPRFGIDQTRRENWLHPQALQYNKNKYIYRLVNPFNEGELANLNDCPRNGYIEFDVRDPQHVVFNRVDAGWTCRSRGLYKYYAYNMIGYYMEDLRESGTDWETAQQFLMAYNNPDLPYTTFKDNVVDLGAMLYAGDLVYDSNFGDDLYPAGGNIWIGFNMRSKIYLPGAEVDEPWIDFEGTPTVEYDSETGSAAISLDFKAGNMPGVSYVFVIVTDEKTGQNVARKYVKSGTSYSFTLDNVNQDCEYSMIVRIEGGLSEALTNSLPVKLRFYDEPKELKSAGVDEIGEESSAPVYYNLQGVKIDKPRKGEIYIKVVGNKATKVVG